MPVVNADLRSADARVNSSRGKNNVGLLAVLGVFVLGFLALGLGQGIEDMLTYGAGMGG
ncbi:hypothetical protein [Pseudoclavibacter helvolus]|uniref:hypothetical protein n=1 Tax=Pseudoclavibacter helvolus TaxID=255205 RepID=UPI0024ADC557|nr:hypothetical protein [Pseudoclavibacter helvolus]